MGERAGCCRRQRVLWGVLAEPRLPADDSAHFRKRGSILWNQQDNTLSLSQRQLNEEERGRLRVRRGPGAWQAGGDVGASGCYTGAPGPLLVLSLCPAQPLLCWFSHDQFLLLTLPGSAKATD